MSDLRPVLILDRTGSPALAGLTVESLGPRSSIVLAGGTILAAGLIGALTLAAVRERVAH